MRFTTFISGYNTAEQPVDDGAPALSELTPEQQLERVERVEQFSELHFVQVRGAGVWKPESIRRLAERRGIGRLYKSPNPPDGLLTHRPTSA